jgi:hypothetical protein
VKNNDKMKKSYAFLERWGLNMDIPGKLEEFDLEYCEIREKKVNIISYMKRVNKDVEIVLQMEARNGKFIVRHFQIIGYNNKIIEEVIIDNKKESMETLKKWAKTIRLLTILEDV